MLIFALTLIAYVLSILLCIYSYKSADLRRDSNNLRFQAIASIIFFAAGLYFSAYLFLAARLLSAGAAVLWVTGFSIQIYDTILVGKTIRRVRAVSWKKLIRNTPGSVYNLAGLSLLAFYIIPVSLYEAFRPASIELSYTNLSLLMMWILCLSILALAARARVRSESHAQTSEKPEDIILLEDDVLIVKAYGYLINRLLTSLKQSTPMVREAVEEFLKYNPILFQGCTLGPEDTVNFEPAVGNINRIEETNRIQQTCLIFSALCTRILGLHSAITSAASSEEILSESFHAAQEKYNNSPLFVEILRSLPEGVLEDERIVLLSKKELETRVRDRTRELEEARDDQNHLLEELRAAEANLRRVITENADSIIIVDSNKMVRFVNPAAERLFGRKAEEWLGQKFEYPIEPNELLEIEIAGENNEKTIAEIRTVEIEWEEQKASLASVRDITDRIRIEEERRQLETQLQQTQKLEAVGTLAGGIAHDFNNILAAIIGFTELTAIDLPEGHPLRGNLQEVLTAGRRAKALIQQILSFAKPTDQEKKLLQIHSILDEALAFARASLPATIEIKQNIVKESGVIMADPTQIHQVLMNLFTNAGHAMKETGGVLEVSLTEVKLDEEDAVSPDLKSGMYTKLTVSDTGYGMDKETLQRIFDPFFTTKGPGEGTGLGLAVVHGIIRSHNGAIMVQTELGRGTTFEIYLPLILAKAEGRPSVETIPLPRGSERIIFVDDEKSVAILGQKFLERQGYQVTSLTSSLETLELFKKDPYKYDLVITDMTMPHMTGLKLAKELIRIRPDIPVIVCTGYSQQISPEMARKAGIKRLLVKPIDINDVANAVRSVLNDNA